MAENLDHVARIRQAWATELPDVDTSRDGRHRPIAPARPLPDRAAGASSTGGYGLGEGEFDVLATLRRAGAPFERAPGDLAAHTMVTTGAMTKRLDRLERDGLVTRRASSTDGRGRVVGLTEPGRELIERVFAEHMRNERRLLDELTAADARDLELILTRWLARFENPA